VATAVAPLHPADDAALAAALVALQRAAYAVEARLFGHDLPVRVETPAALALAGLTWWGWREGSRPLGAVAVTATADLVDIERLVVAPDAARRGMRPVSPGVAPSAGRR
jgi:hypothetical protein